MKKFISILILCVFLFSLSAVAEDVPEIKRVVLTNCDTGRCVYTEQYNQFVCHEYSDGTVSFTNERSSAYLNFTGNGMEYDYNEIKYTLKDVGYSRYQIVTLDGLLVVDSDEGETDAATITLVGNDEKAMCTVWYITETPEDVVKILPLGDSLTWGENPDKDGLNESYRRALSGFLIDYFDKVVFTGNQPYGDAECGDKMLMRHSGYRYGVIENAYMHNPRNQQDLSEITPSIMEKYTPNIVIMLLGTRDCGLSKSYSSSICERQMAELIDRYEKYARSVESKLPKNGTLICCTIPPSPKMSAMVDDFNKLITERVLSLKEEGLKIELCDIYGKMEGGEDIYICSDKMSINDDGNEIMAECICRTVASLYGRNGVKGEGQEIEFEEESVPEEESSTPESKEESKPESNPEPRQDNNKANPMVFLFAGIGLLMLVLAGLLIFLKIKNK